MAGQGRTVDHSLVLVDGPIDAAGLYVPMTRGREGNDVWVVVDPESPDDAVDVLTEAMHRRWIDEPALAYLPGHNLDVAIAADAGLDLYGSDCLVSTRRPRHIRKGGRPSAVCGHARLIVVVRPSRPETGAQALRLSLARADAGPAQRV